MATRYKITDEDLDVVVGGSLPFGHDYTFRKEVKHCIFQLGKSTRDMRDTEKEIH